MEAGYGCSWLGGFFWWLNSELLLPQSALMSVQITSRQVTGLHTSSVMALGFRSPSNTFLTTGNSIQCGFKTFCMMTKHPLVIFHTHLQVAQSTQSMSVPNTHYPSLVTTSVAQWNAAHANPVDDEEDTRVVVEEEVFENERFQPFRGWGSLWPGHFLPSDRIGRFGDRQVGCSLKHIRVSCLQASIMSSEVRVKCARLPLWAKRFVVHETVCATK